MPAESAPSSRPFSMWSKPVLGWALYDFGNTIFSLAVITLYFNEWVIEDMDRPDWNVGLMGFIVGMVLIIAMPVAGAVSDQIGRRKPFLAAFTGLCLASTLALAFVNGPIQALVVGGCAVFGYQLALAMYDPMLATVAPPEHHGRVSGLGVGLGYVGVLVANFVLGAIVGDGNKQDAFVPTAIMFALGAAPIFLFVHERGTPRESAIARDGVVRLASRALGQVAATVRHIRDEHAHVGRFLIARFLYVDAIATVLTYMTIYMERVGEFSARDKLVVLGMSMIFAAISAFVAGQLVEVRGPKFVLSSILVLAAFTLLVAGGTGSASLVWVLGPAVGVTLGAVWTSDRVFMMRLSPPPLRGEFFAVYNLIGKLSSGIGPLVLWGGSNWLLHDHGSWSKLDASRVALILLAGAVIGGLLVLRPLTDEDRYPEVSLASDSHA